MEKKIMLTGLQPTGTITLGNYVGAIKQMVNNQGKYKSYLSIADMHAITVPIDAEILKKNIKNLIAIYIACGIDPKQHTIFLQSDNIYHANVSWMLECNVYYGELSRMTQFKDKSLKNQNFTVGLLTYPVLMAADILIYDTNYVPVGVDQKQHVELARDIAERFNKKYGDTFVLPEGLIPTDSAKIMDLQVPTQKMSKSSNNPKSVIRLLDEPDVIRGNIMSATTDSVGKITLNKEEQPGIVNLLNIYAALMEILPEQALQRFENYRYGEFKKEIAEVVVEKLSNIKNRYNELINSNELTNILNDGAKKASEVARVKYELMRKKIGLTKD